MSILPRDLRVSYVQTDLVWQNPSANCAAIEEKISFLRGQTDIIILPEMFSTGFSMGAESAEIGNGPTVQWMKMQAARLDVLLIGSLKFKSGSNLLNRLFAVFPDGQVEHYDKRHLFRMGGEDASYTAGTTRLLILFKGWKIAPFICYDLRFPVWSRNVHLAYDLAIYVANWPDARTHVWNTLLRARAIENLAYVVGVNRVETDGNGLRYEGNSAIISCKGIELNTPNSLDEVHTELISWTELQDLREKFPAYLDADSFTLD